MSFHISKDHPPNVLYIPLCWLICQLFFFLSVLGLIFFFLQALNSSDWKIREQKAREKTKQLKEMGGVKLGAQEKTNWTFFRRLSSSFSLHESCNSYFNPFNYFWLINCLFSLQMSEYSKKKKNAIHNWAEPTVTSSNCWFCRINSSESIYSDIKQTKATIYQGGVGDCLACCSINNKPTYYLLSVICQTTNK